MVKSRIAAALSVRSWAVSFCCLSTSLQGETVRPTRTDKTHRSCSVLVMWSKNVLLTQHERRNGSWSTKWSPTVMGMSDRFYRPLNAITHRLHCFRPNSALLTMMKDQFANYVVQKVSLLSDFRWSRVFLLWDDSTKLMTLKSTSSHFRCSNCALPVDAVDYN